MSKRKPAKKVAAKAQRSRQAVVRSPRPSHVRLVAAGPNETQLNVDSTRDAPVLEQAALFEQAAAALPNVESPAIASQDETRHTKSENDFAKAFDVFPAAPTTPAHLTKLPEIAQTNMQLAFEFAQRFAQIKSPFQIPSVLSELMFKQFAIFQKAAFPNQSAR
jgi:hypothetical protein